MKFMKFSRQEPTFSLLRSTEDCSRLLTGSSRNLTGTCDENSSTLIGFLEDYLSGSCQDPMIILV
jgi:hypothetical protein